MNFWKQRSFAKCARQIRDGLSRAEVQSVLGSADEVDFDDSPAGKIETWRYSLGESKSDLSQHTTLWMHPALPGKSKIVFSVHFSSDLPEESWSSWSITLLSKRALQNKE